MLFRSFCIVRIDGQIETNCEGMVVFELLLLCCVLKVLLIKLKHE